MIDRKELLDKIRKKIVDIQFSSKMLESMLPFHEQDIVSQDYRALLSVYRANVELCELYRIYNSHYARPGTIEQQKQFEKDTDELGEMIVGFLERNP